MNHNPFVEPNRFTIRCILLKMLCFSKDPVSLKILYLASDDLSQIPLVRFEELMS